MLWLELKVFRYRPKKHFTDLNPIGAVRRQKESLQVASSTHVIGRALIQLLRQDFQHSHWNVTIQKGKPFEKESSRQVDTKLIASPMFETKFDKRFEDIQSFRGRDIPMAALLDFGGQPRFYQGAAGQHGSRANTFGRRHFFFIVCKTENVAVTNDWNLVVFIALTSSHLANVIPFGGTRITL